MEKLNAQQTRGKKKQLILKRAVFEGNDTALKWIKEQATWTDDIKAYEDSIKPVEKEEPKPKEKK